MNKMLPMLRVATVFSILIILTLGVPAALADDECKDPIADWQPREQLKKQLEQQGWVVKRIRIDDGCYEVRALDDKGRRVKATYAPASLALLELEVKHDKHPKREHEEPQHQSH